MFSTPEGCSLVLQMHTDYFQLERQTLFFFWRNVHKFAMQAVDAETLVASVYELPLQNISGVFRALGLDALNVSADYPNNLHTNLS